MRLAYSGAEGCPAEDVVKAAIGAQVRRWDPFAPNAPWRLSVTLVRRAGGYEGAAELRDVLGVVPWSRPLLVRARCFDLVEDLALMVALQINPPRPPPRPVTEVAMPSPPPEAVTRREEGKPTEATPSSNGSLQRRLPLLRQ